MTKKRIAAVLIMALLIGLISYNPDKSVSASSISEIESEQSDNSEEQEELEQAQEELEASLEGLNSTLYDTTQEISEVEDQIADIEEQMETINAQLTEAEDQQADQYADMKLRIQFMYENSNQTGWAYILSSGSLSEMLERIDYISEITTKDRELMAEYEETVSTISTCQAELEAKQAELLASQTELKEKESQLLTQISTVNTQVADNEAAQAANSAEAKKLQDQLDKMKALEAAQEAADREKNKGGSGSSGGKKGGGSGGSGGTDPVDTEVGEEELLAALIYCEAGSQCYEGMMAVGSVVINRVNDSRFPNSITEVVYQKGQFYPFGSGRLALVLENDLTPSVCKKAAREVIAGHTTGTWLYFHVDDGSGEGDSIGGNLFYWEY